MERLNRFIINNYRGILHIIMMLEYLFFSWVLGLNEIYDLDPNHLPIKLVFLVICFFSAQFSIKYTKIDKFFEEEKKKLDK